MSIYGGSIYPSSIYPGNIYDVNIYDPQPVYLEQEIEELLKKNEKELQQLFDNFVNSLDGHFDDWGKKSFLLGVAIGNDFANEKYEGRQHRDEYFKRSVIFKDETDDYKEFREKIDSMVADDKFINKKKTELRTDAQR